MSKKSARIRRRIEYRLLMCKGDKANGRTDERANGRTDERPSTVTFQPSTPTVQHSAPKASELAIIYQSEMAFVSRCIMDYPNIETGGQMFGYWTDDGTPVVLYAIGPGPHANHQTAFFNQDIRYLETVGNILTQRYGLQHIGEWHSHHKLGLARPSGHDAASMANGIAASGRNRFLLCIGNCTSTTSTLNPFNFVSGRGVDYTKAQWLIKPQDSPFRALIDREIGHLLCLPDTREANYSEARSIPRETQNTPAPVQKPLYDADYWLADKSNNAVLKAIMDFLNTSMSVSGLKPLLDDHKHVCLTFTYRRIYSVTITFPGCFPTTAPVFRICRTNWIGSETECQILQPQWFFDGDIYHSFVEYYKNIEIL